LYRRRRFHDTPFYFISDDFPSFIDFADFSSPSTRIFAAVDVEYRRLLPSLMFRLMPRRRVDTTMLDADTLTFDA